MNVKTINTSLTSSVGPLTLHLGQSAWLSAKAATYALERLWAVVSGGLPYTGHQRIVFTAASAQAAYQLTEAKPNAIVWVDLQRVLPEGVTLPIDTDKLPLLFAPSTSPSEPLIKENSDGMLHCKIDLVSMTFFMLSRWEEAIKPERDAHGRFPSHASLAAQQGFLERPIVDEWALVLRAWLQALTPDWQAKAGRFRVLLSHDVDSLLRYPFLKKSILKPSAVALVRRKAPVEAVRILLMGLKAYLNWKTDPHYQGLQKLMTLSEQHQLDSAFYFKTSAPGPFDSGYDLSQAPYLSMLREVQRRGHEIGFHPGYEAFKNPALLQQEKQRLDKLLAQSTYGGRQHYLRFQAPETWRVWAALGLTYDSTLTYADQPGFRCGTCHPYSVYDFENDTLLNIVEIPLIVMEKSLFSPKYQNVTPHKALEQIIILARRSQAVGGIFTFLWHNSFFMQAPQWAHIYDEIVALLAQMIHSQEA